MSDDAPRAVAAAPTAPRRNRDARRAERSRQGAVQLGYIRRRIPAVELLHNEAIEIIEHNAETLLQEIGVEFRRDPESLRLWRAAGADPSRSLQGTPRDRASVLRGACAQPRAHRALRW